MELRAYQVDGRDKIRGAFANGARRVLYVLPTGGGKTQIFSHIAAGVYQRRKRVVILAHRDFLLDQISAALREWRVPHGILTGGRIGVPRHHVVVASVMTLKNRIRHIPAPDLLIGDEAHHFCRENTWGKIVQAWPTAKVLGVTATPVRTDAQPLGNMFDEMVVGPSVAELTGLGYLSPTEVYAPSMPDLAGVSRRMGDYAVAELETVMDKPQLTGSAVAHYQKITPGQKGVAFCVSLKHAEDVAHGFRETGVRSEIISGKMERHERNVVLQRFVTGETQVMTACDLVSEGFDCPAIEVAILLRPTQSLGLYMQQVGRAIRPSPGKTKTVVLDHAGNTARHNFIDAPRDWNLYAGDERERSEDRVPPVRTCPKCFAMFRPAPICPRCGYVIPIKSRTVKQKAGELELVAEATAYAEPATKEADTMKNYERQYFAMLEIGRKRKYSNPQAWALSVVSARLARDLAKARPAGDGTVNGLFVGELDELRARTINRAMSKESQ